jgi:type IV pilus assembly protein PilC
MIYRYSAYSSDKKIVNGRLESASMEMAEASLYRAGFKRILRLQQTGSDKIDFKKLFFGPPKVGKQPLLDFTNELAILIESGLTLLMGLRQLERQSADPSLRKVVVKLSAELQAGTPFHQALSQHPQVFSETYCSIIEANEKAGTLDAGLRQIAKELKQQIELKSQIQRAITQPAIIIVLALVVVILMSIVVLPPLADIFRQFGANLPLTTRILIGFSDFMKNYKFYILLFIFVFILIVITAMKQPGTKKMLDRFILKVPLFGDIMIWHNTARFTRTMSNLLAAGILLPDTINIMLRTISNTYIRDALAEVRKQLVQGQSLSSAISKNKLFPQLLGEMTAVGESSGELESALGTVADYFESKTEKRVTRLTSLLEPILIVGVGLVVAFMAISMISTIYGLVGTFNAG